MRFKKLPFVATALLCLFDLTVYSQWVKQTVDTTASLRGLAVVNEKVVWASGTGGTVIRTIDGGKTWYVMTVPGAEKLDFRDIEAFDEHTVYVLSIGNGESSRIYKTTDGGKTWNLLYQNANEKAFFDAISCGFSSCYVLGDPLGGKFMLGTLASYSEGKRIGLLAPDTASFRVNSDAPDALDGEAAFAASGTCLLVSNGMIWFVSGGTAARVFRSSDRGKSWGMANAPLAHGSSGAGAFSIAMFDEHRGVIVGGDYQKPDETSGSLAFTQNSGVTWKAAKGLTGYRSGVAYVDKKTIIAVGTNGSDITRDGGKTWKKFGDENLNAVQARGKKAVWAVGPKGMVVKMKY